MSQDKLSHTTPTTWLTAAELRSEISRLGRVGRIRVGYPNSVADLLAERARILAVLCGELSGTKQRPAKRVKPAQRPKPTPYAKGTLRREMAAMKQRNAARSESRAP